jgi:glutathione S-transferase
MLTLFHHPFCPHSRFIRLALAEHNLDARPVEERVWERREDFLVLNPAGTTPVLVAEGHPPVPGATIIAEFLDEAWGGQLGDLRLLPRESGARVEVRRLMSWFHDKFFAEVSGPLTSERFYKAAGRRTPRCCVRRATTSAIIWPISAGWCARATGSPASG